MGCNLLAVLCEINNSYHIVGDAYVHPIHQLIDSFGYVEFQDLLIESLLAIGLDDGNEILIMYL
jgi:hypothetical protein